MNLSGKDRWNAIWDMAYCGDFTNLKSVCKSVNDFNMAIMGSSSASFDILKGCQTYEEIKKIVPTLDDISKKRAKILDQIVRYYVSEGGSLLWSIQAKRTNEYDTKLNSFFIRVSMRKGPGDISKGSFKKS